MRKKRRQGLVCCLVLVGAGAAVDYPLAQGGEDGDEEELELVLHSAEGDAADDKGEPVVARNRVKGVLVLQPRQHAAQEDLPSDAERVQGRGGRGGGGLRLKHGAFMS
eukprot:763584-Hanusia_phi.AAC.5